MSQAVRSSLLIGAAAAILFGALVSVPPVDAQSNSRGARGASSGPPELNLTYERFTLDNGLRVIVHEDRKAPVVAVSIWYHVGSKNEPQGKTGFAHLFEHLMFNGTE